MWQLHFFTDTSHSLLLGQIQMPFKCTVHHLPLFLFCYLLNMDDLILPTSLKFLHYCYMHVFSLLDGCIRNCVWNFHFATDIEGCYVKVSSVTGDILASTFHLMTVARKMKCSLILCKWFHVSTATVFALKILSNLQPTIQFSFFLLKDYSRLVFPSWCRINYWMNYCSLSVVMQGCNGIYSDILCLTCLCRFDVFDTTVYAHCFF